MKVEELVDEVVREQLIAEYRTGRLTPAQAVSHLRNLGIAAGAIDVYDMADWLRTISDPSVTKPKPKASRKKGKS